MRSHKWILCMDSTSKSPLAPGIITAKGLCVILGDPEDKKEIKRDRPSSKMKSILH